jgi:hypothetical protein
MPEEKLIGPVEVVRDESGTGITPTSRISMKTPKRGRRGSEPRA